jgi:tRNA U34 5-methylaminomethyl-2-thiouridine-forming methyltransferase MnmC
MPKSYDDITRKTVPEPDSSWRPTPEQVKQAHEGFRAMDPGEQELHARVAAAVGASIDVEVDGDRVTLRGQVADAEALTRIPELARAVAGVAHVDDQLVVASK